MGKQNFVDKHFGALVAVALIVGLLYWGSGQSWDFSKFNLINIGITLNTAGGQNQTGTPGQTVYVDRTNLCNAYQPTINELAAFFGVHPSTSCAAGGGTWRCDADHCGCYNYVPVVDCTNPIYIHMMAQCNAYGATGICDDHNAYCEYR